MPGLVGQFTNGAQKATTAPFGMFSRFCDPFENRQGFFRQAALRLFEPDPECIQIRLIARLQIGGYQIVLALEMVVNRLLGDACLFRHSIDADGPNAVAVKQMIGCIQYALFGIDTVARHGLYTHWCVYKKIPPR